MLQKSNKFCIYNAHNCYCFVDDMLFFWMTSISGVNDLHLFDLWPALFSRWFDFFLWSITCVCVFFFISDLNFLSMIFIFLGDVWHSCGRSLAVLWFFFQDFFVDDLHFFDRWYVVFLSITCIYLTDGFNFLRRWLALLYIFFFVNDLNFLSMAFIFLDDILHFYSRSLVVLWFFFQIFLSMTWISLVWSSLVIFFFCGR